MNIAYKIRYRQTEKGGRMATQAEKAKKIGMLQPNYSKWCKRIATDLESCMIGEAARVLKSEGYEIRKVKMR